MLQIESLKNEVNAVAVEIYELDYKKRQFLDYSKFSKVQRMLRSPWNFIPKYLYDQKNCLLRTGWNKPSL